MKFLHILTFILTFALFSCKNINSKNSSNTEENLNDFRKTEIEKMSDFLRKYEVPSQKFKISVDKPQQLKGKKGTRLFINPNDLETESGQALGKSIEIELKELTNQEHFLRTNVQTVSNGKLLVSGGAYYINITSDGQNLRLKKGKKLSVDFGKFTNSKMSLFYGELDSLGKLNWRPSDIKFETKQKAYVVVSDTFQDKDGSIDGIFAYINEESNRPISAEEKKEKEELKKNTTLADNLYKTLEIKQLGWINCDRFYDIDNKTNLKFTFNSNVDITIANVYLIFKDINSLMQSSYFSYRDKEFNSSFENIPIGSKTTIIAFAIKDGKAYSYKKDLTIEPNKSIQLTLTATEEKEINKLFDIN